MNKLENMSVLDKLRNVSNSICNPYVEEWKRNGGKVLGYLYSYIPEEIITAAGLMPFHIRGTGSEGTELSDARFTQVNCSFVRHCLNQVLHGELDFLDGVIVYDNCDHAFRMVDNWKALRAPGFLHTVVVPKKRGEAQTHLFFEELQFLRKKIEEQFDVEITDQKLAEAIQIHNDIRTLQKRLYQLKTKKNPPISGADTLAVMVAGTAMPKDKYRELLEQLIVELEAVTDAKVPNARLMLIGGELDNPSLVEAIESQGGIVVTDALYYGTRSMWKNISESGNPVKAIAEYYLNERPVDPRIFGTGEDRKHFYEEIAKAFSVDGIICVRYPFCDKWAFEQDNIEGFVKEMQIPYLRLECEYALASTGQMKTRVQAFIETMEED